MKKITALDISLLIQSLPLPLIATHDRISVPIVNRIYQKMKLGLLFPPIKTNHQRICDGHHRYLAAQLANYPIEPIPWCISSNVQTQPWSQIVLDTADWDSPAVIRKLNKKDALYNGLLLEDLLYLLNKN